MNTSKQVNVMIGLMFLVLVGTLLYFIWDNVRAEDAEQRQLVVNAERGGKLFSLNCRACHGVNGLGTLDNTLLPGLPLNLPSNRPVNPETNLPDPGKLMDLQSRFRDTIRCGRLGTLMPPWAQEQGGPLNEFQIDQLITLISGAMPGLDPPDNLNAVSEKGWEAAVEEADHADLLKGKKLAEAVGVGDTVFVLTVVKELNVDSLLRIDDEVVSVVAISDDRDEITVERAAFQTQAAEHEEGAQVFAGPIEPPTGPLLEVACSQTLRGPAPSGTPPPATPPAAGATATEIKMIPVIQFDKAELTIAADRDVTITADNAEENIPHNFAVYTSQQDAESGADALGATAICVGSCTDTVTLNLSAGEYFFRCDVHPIQMTGRFIVTE